MKKLISFFICIFMAASVTLNAQDYARKGVFELGGLVMYANNTLVVNGETEVNGESVSLNFFFVNMPLSYFVIDGLQIGVIPEYVSVGVSNSTDLLTLSTLGIYFATAYNFNLKSSVYPFIQGRFGYNSIGITSELDPNTLQKTSGTQQNTLDETLTGIGWGFSGGIKVQLAKGALLSLGVGYQQRTANPEDNPGDLRNGLNVIVVQAGFSVFLGR